MHDHGDSSPRPSPGAGDDSPLRFCNDFAAVLDSHGISLRGAAQRSGWGKSTIAAARRGPDLPNLQLILDVLQAIDVSGETQQLWQERYERLQAGTARPRSVGNESPFDPAGAAPAADPPLHHRDDAPSGAGLSDTLPGAGQPHGAPADASASLPRRTDAGDDPGHDPGRDIEQREKARAQPESEAGPGRSVARTRTGRHLSRRVKILAVAVPVLALIIAGTVWWLVRGDGTPAGRTIVVQNKVAFGASDLREDDSPSYLVARPITRCASVPGCKLSGTDLASGDTVEAVCQLQGALQTNADVRSTGIETNPNATASSLWYGVRWPDGRRGYISEVYIAPMYRGGLQLPPC